MKFYEFAHKKMELSENEVYRLTKITIKKGEVIRRKVPNTRIALLGLN